MPKPVLKLAFASAIALSLPLPAFAAPAVVASLKPLHSLVAGVMEGVGTPELIVRGAASEHGYALRPSDAARIEAADVVFWIGEEMETYLTGVIDTLASDAVVVGMMDIYGLTLLGLREGGLFEPHVHEEGGHDHEGHDHHDHDHEGHDHEEHDHEGHDHDGPAHAHAHEHVDAHIWLDPYNARLMVTAIVDTLATVDPENAEAYDANGRALAARIGELQTELEATLDGLEDKPFFVFHDAYHYFEARFGIEAAGAFTINPEITPGAARLEEIRGVVEASEAACLFVEPQFRPGLVETVAEGTSARTGTLDPLGADIEDGPELYFTLMSNLATSLRDCLAG